MLIRLCQTWLMMMLCCLLSGLAQADAIPVSPTLRHTGNVNYVATGGSLRTASNAVDACAVGSSDTESLAGIPVGATIRAAYLYWGGSGNTTDSTVSLNGNTIFADRTFTETSGGNNFFGGFANVTSRISGNGSITFGNLTVSTGNPWCSAGNVLAGWALVVVYEAGSEPLRAINIYDGLEAFYNSSITRNPTGFRIPTSGIDGKFTAITWEGDPDIGGASEVLAFNGSTVDVQGYDSSSHFSAGSGGITTNGADIDTYNVSGYLSPGQTSATTLYSAGGDRVFLTAQIISVTSEPQVDLSITKTHSGNFTVGTNATYTLHVANAAGVQQVDYLTTVSDTLPAGLTFVSASGTGWSCGAVGQVVTCTHAAPLASGSAFPDITLTVAVGNAAYPSVSNTASVVTAGSNDFTSSNNSATDVAAVNGTNFSTSTKTVVDLNGGEANPGDTLRYTITLVNSTNVNATGVSVSDALPGNTTNLNVVSYPGSASNTSTTSQLTINNISVPANGSVTIVFDVSVIVGTSPGALIDNTATITNPAGPGATPAAPTITVSPSLVAQAGIKPLYLWTSPTRLYRTPPAVAQSATTITGGTASSWTLSPALQKALTLRGGSGVTGNFPVYLLIANANSSTGSQRSVTVSLLNGATTLASATLSVPATTTPTLRSFSLNLPANVVVNTGSTLTLQVSNGAASGRWITVTPFDGSQWSRVELNSLTVINVDSVQSYNAAYSGGVVTNSFVRGNTVYVRAVVSDPFGSYDISSANITLTNPSGTVMVNTATMTQVADSNAATKTYEYAYAVPANAVAGVWNVNVLAREGTENNVTDYGVASFTVTIPLPSLQVAKISSVIWDPVNGSSNPKRIPGAIVSYTITVTNTGSGTVDASTLVITDPVPANTSLCVVAAAQCVPISFADGTPASGLSYAAGNTTFSNTAGGGTPFTYSPSANANGVDAAVTGLRIAPTGTMNAAGNGGGSGNPSFTVNFRVKLN